MWYYIVGAGLLAGGTLLDASEHKIGGPIAAMGLGILVGAVGGDIIIAILRHL